MLGSSDIDPPLSTQTSQLTSNSIPVQQILHRPTSNLGEYFSDYYQQKQHLQQRGWFAIRAGGAAADRPPTSSDSPTMETTASTTTSTTSKCTTTTAEENENPQETIFDWQPELDYVDNEEQLQVIKHHYASEFSSSSSSMSPDVVEREFLEDYRNDCVVYSVLDEIPSTFHGLEGARKSCESVVSLLEEPSLPTASKDGKPATAAHFYLKHISIKVSH